MSDLFSISAGSERFVSFFTLTSAIVQPLCSLLTGMSLLSVAVSSAASSAASYVVMRSGFGSFDAEVLKSA